MFMVNCGEENCLCIRKENDSDFLDSSVMAILLSWIKLSFI